MSQEGEVAGLVETRRKAPAPAAAPSLLTALSYVAAPVVLFALVALALGERRVPLGVVALALLAGTVQGYGAQSWAKLERARNALEKDVALAVKADAAQASEAIAASCRFPRAATSRAAPAVS